MKSQYFMKSLIYTGIFLVIVLTACKNQAESSMEQFRGMYKLDKFETLDSTSGTWGPEPSREGWSGYIIYDGLGHMAVHLLPGGYKDFDANKKIDSLSGLELNARAKFYASNYVYFADYSIKDSDVAHHKLTATEPRDWGTMAIRNFEFRGDTLILKPHEKIGGLIIRLKWVRMK